MRLPVQRYRMVRCQDGVRVDWGFSDIASQWMSLKVCGDFEDACSYLLGIIEGDVSDGFPVRFFP